MVRDMRNTRPEKQSLTPMQKQAVLVCSVCALAAILTIAITLTLLKRGKTPAAPVEQPSSEVLVPGEEDISDHYQISETSTALLPETADAGESYQKETLFLGDSNTVRLYANGLISLQQFCAKEGIGTHAALTEGIVTFKKDSSTYTIAQAVAKMKPRRVVIMLGTNDTGMSVEEFISNYTALVQAIQESYPYTDIIVNTVPPVPANHSNYPNMDQTKIDDFNMALLSMCEQMGLKFLNSAEALKDANGYGREDYYQTGDIHLKPVGLKAMLSYLRTHAYQTEDRRPDTANIPTRAEYTPNPSSAVAAPSSSEAAESASSSEQQGVLYQASYRVDKTGGTLSSGSDSGKTSLSYEVTSAAQSISVTAVPQDGYVFVKWSDGVTQKTRTDTNFKQNVDVTAVFAAASVHISSTGKAVLGDSYTFTAKLGGKYLTADSIRWYANGVEVPQAAGKTTVKVEIDPSMLNATFKVYAVASYNGCTVTSNTLNVTVSGVSSGSTSSSGSSSSSSGSTSGSSSGSASSGSGSTSSSGASSGTTSGASSGATSTSGSSSHSASSSESTASSAGSGSASNGTAGSSHSTSTSTGSSHAGSGESGSTSQSSSGNESSAASHSSSGSSAAGSGSSHAASESNASREAANEQSASTDSAS